MKDSFSWDRHFATMFFAVWWKTKHVKLLFYSHLQVGGDKNLMCLFLSTFTCAQLSSSLFLIDASGFFPFVYLCLSFLTLGWRSSCLRRPVFSCRVSLCGLFVTLQTIFLISDCWLQYTTKKVHSWEPELRPFITLFFSMAHLSSVALLSVSYREDFSFALAINYSGHELSALHCWLAEWQRRWGQNTFFLFLGCVCFCHSLPKVVSLSKFLLVFGKFWHHYRTSSGCTPGLVTKSIFQGVLCKKDH